MLILSCIAVFAGETKDAYREQLQKIDTQIQKLEVQKSKHINLARKYQAEGDNWQYETGRIEDAHQAWREADDQRAQAIEYQRQIDLLLEEKFRIYQYYPDLKNS